MINYNEQIEFPLSVVEDALTTNTKKFNAYTGRVVKTGTSYKGLGDYLPALQFFGKNDTLTQEIEKPVNALKKENYLFTKDQTGLARCFARAYDQSDLIWGLQQPKQSESR